MRFATALLLLCLASPSFAEESTLGRYILEVNVDAESNTHFQTAK